MTALTPDTWLSEVMSRPVYRVSPESDLSTLRSQHPVFAYAKIRADQPEAAKKLVSAGFKQVDTLVTFKKSVAGNAMITPSLIVRKAGPGDESAVATLARGSFKYSRFHADPQIKRELADTIKSEWARNFFRGARGDEMFVAQKGSGPVLGFLQMLQPRPGDWVIDLIAVGAEAQGQGVGTALINHAERHCAGIKTLTVGTQQANEPSMLFYQNLDFKLFETNYVFHFHG